MLAHISQTSPVIIPVPSEVGVYTFLIVGFEWSRSQPHFIVEYIRHRLRLQVGLTAPVKFPVETSSSTDGCLQRPTQGPVFDEFFDWFDGHSHAVKVGRKPEPGIQPKHTVMPLHRIDDGQTFANGSDRKSTRLTSSHVKIWYAVFCLKKKNT